MTAIVESALERETMRKVSMRLLPFLFVLYLFNFVDRSNVALAALQMNRDLHFSSSAFGFGAGIFFIGYALFEVPSNLILARVGARRWIARIMISWGILAASMMLVRTPMQFYVVRFFLGVAEAGFLPGVVYYLTQWFPVARRARATSRFFIALPMSGVFGGALGGYLLGLDGLRGLHGWQWLFLLEGLPSVLIGFSVLWYLTDRPDDARWLQDDQREWLVEKMKIDHLASGGARRMSAFDAIKLPTVWILAAPYFLMLTAAYGYTFWAPTVIRDTLHTSNSATGFVTAGIACVSMTFMLLHAASSDRNRERFYHAGFGGILIAVGFAGAALLSQPILRVVFLGMVIIGCNAMLSPFWCLPSTILGGEAAAVGIALINSLGNLGGFIGPYAIGFFKDKTGGNTGAFLVLAGFGVGMVILCVALKYTTLSGTSASHASVAAVTDVA
ncbi:MAG: major facilitator superfamily 1 [Bryobacterales bacterium]|nr:major facilitator superfamily 1 [Bryobacterales bacterium]